MPYKSYDYYNHDAVMPGTTLTTAATGTSAAGTVVPVAAGAGSGSSTAIPTGATPNDARGQFNLVTAGTPAAGKVASIFFSNPYSQTPGAVSVTCYDVTGTAAVALAANVVSTSQIDFYTTGTALTTAHTYTINYHVIA